MRKRLQTLLLTLCLGLSFVGCSNTNTQPIINTSEIQENQDIQITETTLETIPEYNGNPYVELNGNIPNFTDEEKQKTSAFEYYSDLDNLKRCGVAFANICQELMPTEERGKIGMIKPSGWRTVKYDSVDGKYLFNRCHLIGFQLAGENANEKNLITGTRSLNIDGMLPFENQVADYVKETNNHVLYRVSPIFQDEELVARGVEIEAWSVEDGGNGVCFNVYCFNNQPGITIDYATGDSWLNEETTTKETQSPEQIVEENTPNIENTPEQTTETNTSTYIVNKNTKKFHEPTCSSVEKIKEENKETMESTREQMIENGYDPCKQCNP